MKSLSCLVLSLFVVSICNGQSNSAIPKVLYASPKKSAGRPKMIKSLGSSEYDNVHCGLQDHNGSLWFGTTGEGVYCYNGKLFTQYTMYDGLSSNSVWAILEDTKGNIWLGTADGVCIYDGKTFNKIPYAQAEKSNLYTANSTINDQSTKKSVWSLMQDKSGKIWLGADDGLFVYNGKTFVRFLDDPGAANTSGLTLNNVQCMLEDKKGNIWFGSGYPAMEGIIRYDGKTLEHFKPKMKAGYGIYQKIKPGAFCF